MVINVRPIAQSMSWKKEARANHEWAMSLLHKVCGRIGAVDSDES